MVEMVAKEAVGSRDKFLRTYSDLPMGLRKEIIIVVDNQPITWNVAYIEVHSKTALSEKILKKLEELKII